VDARERRLAENEVAFRAINDAIEETASRHGADDHRYEFLCECSNADCTLRLQLTRSAYEDVRRRGDQFIVAPGHNLPEIEDVVSRSDDYWVVEKHGEAARLAERRHLR